MNKYNTRNSENLILEKVKLECTNRAFYYKGTKNYVLWITFYV